MKNNLPAGPLRPGEVLQDKNYNKFIIEEEIGHGIVGKTYRATIAKIADKKSSLQEEQEVAVKSQPCKEDPVEIAAQEREVKILQKENMLFSIPYQKDPPPQGPTHFFMIQPFFPGIDLRKAIYILEPMKYSSEEVTRKKDLSAKEKETIAIGILREYAILQQLNIVHCDIKPDNFLYDKASGTVKLIDMGQAFEGSQESPHIFFQAPGMMYMAPECFKEDGGIDRSVVNSSSTDLYSIGIIIASLYATVCYESEYDYNVDSPALSYRQRLADILGPPLVTHVQDMPDYLLKIVQHLTAIDPTERAKSIALARGAGECQEMNDITLSQNEAVLLIRDIKKMDYFQSNHRLKDKAKVIVNCELDLTCLSNALHQLVRENPDSKILRQFVSAVSEKIESFNAQEAAKLQAMRKDKIFVSGVEKRLAKAIEPYQAVLGNSQKRSSSLTFSSKQSSPVKQALLDTMLSIEKNPENIENYLKALSQKIKHLDKGLFKKGGEEKEPLLAMIEKTLTKISPKGRSSKTIQRKLS